MKEINEFKKVPQRELSVFYVLDTSGSMCGAPITMLNRAMIETVEVLKQQAGNNTETKLRVAVLEFNSGCRWIQQDGPEQIEDFHWVGLKAGGTTDIGEALKELNAKLSQGAFLHSVTDICFPIIIFMTDGCATDSMEEYSTALREIRENKWFKNATKIGFAIGSEADNRMISEIVGTSEAVISTDDLELFARLIRYASETASILKSTLGTGSGKVSGKEVVTRAIEAGEAPKDIMDPDVYPEVFEEAADLDLELDWEEWEE